MTRSQRGFSLTQALMAMIVIAFVALFGAKLMPAYIEYYAVKKMLATMEAAGDTKSSVKEIRNSWARRNVIEGIKSVNPDDLEITKEGGEAVITATWSTKVPVIANFSACLDFSVTTAK
ncbi:MAG: DUF4845 domain-containing protein [Betaproteobacteria bacterium]|nr:DUF4845 domain-containing protein [Betaproteobacteria bacterium]